METTAGGQKVGDKRNLSQYIPQKLIMFPGRDSVSLVTDSVALLRLDEEKFAS